MENHSLSLPGFQIPTRRKRPLSNQQKLINEHNRIRRHSLSQLGEHFAHFLPKTLFKQDTTGPFSRRRVFSKENTFWAFFSQILDADGGCREVVRKVQARVISQGLASPSSATSVYCQARQKLDSTLLSQALDATTLTLERQTRDLWNGHRVVVVDGTGLSMPDTKENQEAWPQQSSQTPGCGFPQARLCACFNLHSGALLSYRLGSKKNAELRLMRSQWSTFKSGDIMLGDKGFCSYYDVWQFQKRGVESVFTLARRTPVEAASAVAVLGKDDLLIEWPKTAWNARLSYSKAVWDDMPDTLRLRQIKVTVAEPGFRVKHYYLITTLTDVTRYSASDLADLYYQRWKVELFFRDIKTTMGMDILRCHTPEMVKKEIQMHWIVYNCLRLLMSQSSVSRGITPHQLSFKASLQALRQWEPYLNQISLSSTEKRHLMNQLRDAIADTELIDRPGRREPRCLKRRPKPFALMIKPRAEMREIPHRNKYRAKKRLT